MQVVIENQNNALEYDDIMVDQGSPVRQDMHFDKAGDHLYVMTSNKVIIGPSACRVLVVIDGEYRKVVEGLNDGTFFSI